MFSVSIKRERILWTGKQAICTKIRFSTIYIDFLYRMAQSIQSARLAGKGAFGATKGHALRHSMCTIIPLRHMATGY
jgi:hypothetical protein